MFRHVGAVLLTLFAAMVALQAQSSTAHETVSKLSSPSHSFTFFLRAGTCQFGLIKSADSNSILVDLLGPKAESLKLDWNDVVQISEGNTPVFSSRSSWADVAYLQLVRGESLIVTLKDGKVIKGKLFKIDDGSLVIKHGFTKTQFPKTDISEIDYLRVRPESDGLDYLAQEAPYLLFFDPEFYKRAFGLEGKILVRLYDQKLPEDNHPLQCPDSRRVAK